MGMKLSEWRLRVRATGQRSLDRLNAKTDLASRKFSGLNSKIKMNAGTMRNMASTVMPGMGGAMGALLSPAGLLAGAVIGIGLAMSHAVGEAKEFNYEFLQLKQLNLDKTAEELDSLKDSILGLSFKKGFDPKQTSKAFFDVQSATGLYGDEVERVVGIVGEFAKVNQIDMASSINAVTKGMVAYKLSSRELTGFLESQFKTVQVGVTSFDQLNKVQSKFASDASASGQNFDSANKLFAVFSKAADTQAEAATLTKTAFQDLTKSATQKGLKSLGVSIFDNTGKMRQWGDIAKDLVPKLSKLNDMEFARLKEEIGGSEGIRGALNLLKASGEDVLSTLDAFDNTEFSLAKEIENASESLEDMNKTINGKLSVSWIKLGNAIMPLWIEVKKIVLGVIDTLYAAPELIDRLQAKIHSFLGDDTKQKNFEALDAGGVLASIRQDRVAAFDLAEDNDGRDRARWQLQMGQNSLDKKLKAGGLSEVMKTELEKQFAANASALKSFGQEVVAMGDSRKIAGLDLGGGGGTGTDGTTGTDATSSLKSGVNTIAGGGNRVRNVTVNIQSLINELKIQAQNLPEAATELQAVVEEAMVRAVTGSELALANE